MTGQLYSETEMRWSQWLVLFWNNSNIEQHLWKALAPLAADRAHSCDNLSVFGLQVSRQQIGIPILMGPKRIVCPGGTRHTLADVSKWAQGCLVRLPLHWNLSNKWEPSVWTPHCFLPSPYVKILTGVFTRTAWNLSINNALLEIVQLPFQRSFWT